MSAEIVILPAHNVTPVPVDQAWEDYCALAMVPMAERDVTHSARLRRAYVLFYASMERFLAE